MLMNMPNNQTKIKLNPDVILQRIGNEMILINLKTEQIYSLNHTAARFIELLEIGKSLEDIESQIIQEYDVEPNVLHQDILQMIYSLRLKNFFA